MTSWWLIRGIFRGDLMGIWLKRGYSLRSKRNSWKGSIVCIIRRWAISMCISMRMICWGKSWIYWRGSSIRQRLMVRIKWVGWRRKWLYWGSSWLIMMLLKNKWMRLSWRWVKSALMTLLSLPTPYTLYQQPTSVESNRQWAWLSDYRLNSVSINKHFNS